MTIFRDIRQLDWQKIKTKAKFYTIVLLIILLIVLLIFHVIEFWITFGSSLSENTLFTLTNSAIYGVWFICLGFFNKGLQKNWIRALFFLILAAFLLTGLGFMNVCIRFNLFFMNETYRTYCSGSADSGYFFIYNDAIMLGLIALTFLTEKEIKISRIE